MFIKNTIDLILPDVIDSGYLDDSSYSVLQVTAWIPLLDTNATNGCMQVMNELVGNNLISLWTNIKFPIDNNIILYD